MDEETRLALQEFKSRLEARFGDRLKGVYLFGSRARGDHRPDSDAEAITAWQLGKPRWVLGSQTCQNRGKRRGRFLTDASFQPGWTALKSAKLLFEAGDFNGATDRAYYAMHGIAAVFWIKRASLYQNSYGNA